MRHRVRTLFVLVSLLGAGALVGCQTTERGPAPSEEDLQGRWQVQALKGVSVEKGSRAFLEFSGQPRLTGSGGCNRFFGVYRYHDRTLKIDPALGSTKMACEAAIMLQEQRLFQLLPDAVHAEMVDGRLHLRNQRGETLVQAIRLGGEGRPL